MRYALLLSYAGTSFCGWQKQRGSAAEGDPSIQETIEKTLAEITGERVSIVGSGRTDAGVHAAGQVAHFELSKKDWDSGVLLNALNSQLPRRIRVLRASSVSPDFHAQLSAEKKQYSYYFQQGPCALPHLELYTWWIRKTLDLSAMQESARQLIGSHDFKPFQAAGGVTKTTVRKILEAEVSFEPIAFPGGTHLGTPCGLVRVRLVGTGFLKQMVRGIAGTLLQVGEKRRDSGCFQAILEAQDRDLVGPTAPSCGLWLEQVWYPAGSGWNC
jgi:tRNA pseudouridine38-40 synthase